MQSRTRWDYIRVGSRRRRTFDEVRHGAHQCPAVCFAKLRHEIACSPSIALLLLHAGILLAFWKLARTTSAVWMSWYKYAPASFLITLALLFLRG